MINKSSLGFCLHRELNQLAKGSYEHPLQHERSVLLRKGRGWVCLFRCQQTVILHDLIQRSGTGTSEEEPFTNKNTVKLIFPTYPCNTVAMLWSLLKGRQKIFSSNSECFLSEQEGKEIIIA